MRSRSNTKDLSPRSLEDDVREIIEAASEPWRSHLKSLAAEGITSANVVSWFQGTSLVDAGTVAAPNAFACKWLETHYELSVRKVLGTDHVRFVVQDEHQPAAVVDMETM